jgi:hypothetical protein
MRKWRKQSTSHGKISIRFNLFWSEAYDRNASALTYWIARQPGDRGLGLSQSRLDVGARHFPRVICPSG